MSIQYFEWGATQSRVEACVVPEFSERKLGSPLGWAGVDEVAQISLHTLVHAFRLTIHLGVIYGTHTELDSCQPKQFPPQVTGEHLVAIRYDGGWHPMKLINMTHEGLCNRQGGEGMA